MLMGEFIVMSGSFFVIFAILLCCLHAADGDVSGDYTRARRKRIQNERNRIQNERDKRRNGYRGKMT